MKSPLVQALGHFPIFVSVLGPTAPVNDTLRRVELIEALELVEQLPETPLTLVGVLNRGVLDELLQIYAVIVLGVLVIRHVVATNIAPIKNI
jgi:hypothetical protein